MALGTRVFFRNCFGTGTSYDARSFVLSSPLCCPLWHSGALRYIHIRACAQAVYVHIVVISLLLVAATYVFSCVRTFYGKSIT